MSDVDTPSREFQSSEHLPDLPRLSKREIVFAVLRFNFRLFLDGAKDLILAPLSILTGGVALLLPAHRAPAPLRFLLRTARRLDEAIDLYELPELGPTQSPLSGPKPLPVAESMPARLPSSSEAPEPSTEAH